MLLVKVVVLVADVEDVKLVELVLDSVLVPKQR